MVIFVTLLLGASKNTLASGHQTLQNRAGTQQDSMPVERLRLQIHATSCWRAAASAYHSRKKIREPDGGEKGLDNA